MPIDASSDPYDSGLDPDDLALAGKGAAGNAAAAAAAANKSLEGADDDDDLADAGKGAAGGGAADVDPFEPETVDKALSKAAFGDVGDDLDGDPTATKSVDALDDLDDDDGGLFDAKIGIEPDDVDDDDPADFDKGDIDLDL